METWKESTTIALWLTLGILMVAGLVAFVLKVSRTSIDQRLQMLKKEEEVYVQHSHELIAQRMETIEKERSRIANDLHDGLIGQLNHFRLLHFGRNASSLDAVLKESITLTRQISHDLAPPLLEYKNLQTVLMEISRPWQKKRTVVFDFPSTFPELDTDQKLHILRCGQEILQNIDNHSKANRIEISARTRASWFEITFVDNGCGFDPDTVQKGLGIGSIESRMQLIKGRAVWETGPGSGTSVQLSIPM